jgi:hypothetical protein
MPTLDDKARAEVESAIYAGRKIDAIKLYREAVPGTDLVDAKKAVEELTLGLKQQHPENFGPVASKTGCLGAVVLLAGIVGGPVFMAVLVLVLK